MGDGERVRPIGHLYLSFHICGANTCSNSIERTMYTEHRTHIPLPAYSNTIAVIETRQNIAVTRKQRHRISQLSRPVTNSSTKKNHRATQEKRLKWRVVRVDVCVCPLCGQLCAH